MVCVYGQNGLLVYGLCWMQIFVFIFADLHGNFRWFIFINTDHIFIRYTNVETDAVVCEISVSVQLGALDAIFW